MTDILALPFMQRAMLAAAVTGLLGGVVGVFLVQRRLAFMAAGISHSAFAGIGAGLYLGWAPFAVAAPLAVAVGLGIAYWHRRELAEDTVVGIFFAGGMAAGVILLALSGANAGLSAYLFGSILGIGGRELVALALVALGVIGFFAAAWGRLTLVTFDRELAQASGIGVARLDAAFFAAASLAIVASVKLVGIVLVSSFFVVPAATARLVAATFGRVTLLSTVLGTGTAVGGLLLSYPLQAPVGALIVLLQAGLFGVTALWRRGAAA